MSAFLDRRARICTIRTKYTTVTYLWLQNSVAVFAFVEVLACIRWHSFFFLMSAVWAGNG
ncbi:MAG: hypothetical protein JXQ96_20195 [Cyclobacteriaceae bacterium]